MLRVAIAAGAVALGCATPPDPAAPGSSHPVQAERRTAAHASAGGARESDDSPPSTDAGAPARLEGLHFSHDDVPAATARALRASRPLLVDAWAPWCHTCLSMQHYVLPDPSLATIGARYEGVAVDTDRDENAAFVDRYTIRVWPTLLVIDPMDGAVLGTWLGAASARELRTFLEGSFDAFEARRKDALDPASSLGLLVAAKDAHARGDGARAAPFYERAVAASDVTWPRRSEALLGWISVLEHDRRWTECVAVGTRHLAEVSGAAIPSDFIARYWSCLLRTPRSRTRDQAAARAMARLSEITENPSPEMSADDVADAYAILAEAHEDRRDRAAARRTHGKRLAYLEAAAARAPTPAMAQTFDYARLGSYLTLGRAADAVAMLTERERQLPDSYEAAARLATALDAAGKTRDAVAALERAIAKSYGPRQLLYLSRRVEFLERLRDEAAVIRALEDLVAAHEAVPKESADPKGLAAARTRLEKARAGAR